MIQPLIFAVWEIYIAEVMTQPVVVADLTIQDTNYAVME